MKIPGTNQVDQNELVADALGYFDTQKYRMRSEFSSEMKAKLGKQLADEFFDILASEWYDGKSKRNTGRSQRLKRSVYDYLRETTNVCRGDWVLRPFDLDDVEPLISSAAVNDILDLNDQFLTQYIYEWMQQHPEGLFLSRNEVYLRRGLAVDELPMVEGGYKEWDFLNSYSIAISAPEKFAQASVRKKPVIINGDLDLFRRRVLFFSPFIPDMDGGQLEFGIIPSKAPLRIQYQGEYGKAGIHEYLLEPQP